MFQFIQCNPVGRGFIELDEFPELSDYDYNPLDWSGQVAARNILYYHNSPTGTPLTATNAAGQVAWRAGAEPFGLSAPSGTAQNLRFPGQYHDAETGLDYNMARYYHPGLGRYLQADPIGLAGGVNEYGYVGNSPVNAIDPLGLIKLPADPSGLPPNWNPDPSHRDPNGERWTNGTDVLDFHKGRPGMPGWRGKDHWHHNGGDNHLEPGDQCPTSDDPPVDTPDQNFQIEPPPPWWVIPFLIPFPGNPLYGGF